MSWMPMSFLTSTLASLSTIRSMHPNLYAQLDNEKKAPFQKDIEKIALLILGCELVRGEEFSDRIFDMMENLPNKKAPKNLKTLFQTRFKAILRPKYFQNICVAGIDLDFQQVSGKYFAMFDKDEMESLESSKDFERILTRQVAHHLRHMLADDQTARNIYATLATFVASAGLVGVFGSTLPVAAATAVTAACVHSVAQSFLNRYYESRAEAFAKKV